MRKEGRGADGPKLLAIHQGALGDFVASIPALLLLRETHPVLHVLAPGSHGRLAVRFGVADHSRPIEGAGYAALFGGQAEPQARARVREVLDGYTRILLFSFSEDLAENVRGATCARVYRIPSRPAADQGVHVMDHQMDRLVRLGLLDPRGAFDPACYPLKDAKRTGPLTKDPLRVLIHPGAGSRRKMYPLDRWIKVHNGCRARGLRPRFLLGPAESDLAASMAGLGPVHRPEHLDGLVDLLQGSAGFIGNDSGVSHLAAFCGLPVVAVFGPSDPVRWRPVGPAVAVVRPGTDCEPCFETDPARCDGTPCFGTITPAMVLAAWDRVCRVA